jgi:hypothetical protein
MGLLDDAIREHLALKRQHGADPAEVERQEHEALGAPRQAEFAATPDEGGSAAPFDAGEPAADEPLAPAAGDEPPTAVEPVAADEPAPVPLEGDEPDEPVAETQTPVDAGGEREPFDIEALEDEVPPQEPELPAPGAEAGAPGYDEDPWLEEERDEVPSGESLDRPREDAEESAEDVLEDTPDFLQETPEHDRLWFEQKPPRDFDWDK